MRLLVSRVISLISTGGKGLGITDGVKYELLSPIGRGLTVTEGSLSLETRRTSDLRELSNYRDFSGKSPNMVSYNSELTPTSL